MDRNQKKTLALIVKVVVAFTIGAIMYVAIMDVNNTLAN